MKITYDGEVRAGDLLESRSRRPGNAPTGTVYRVLYARQVRSRVYPERYALDVERLTTAPAPLISTRQVVRPLFWHPRRRRRA